MQCSSSFGSLHASYGLGEMIQGTEYCRHQGPGGRLRKVNETRVVLKGIDYPSVKLAGDIVKRGKLTARQQDLREIRRKRTMIDIIVIPQAGHFEQPCHDAILC